MASVLLMAAPPSVVPQVSKGFAVSIQSLWANQTARALLAKHLTAERVKTEQLTSMLETRDSQIHDQEGQVCWEVE